MHVRPYLADELNTSTLATADIKRASDQLTSHREAGCLNPQQLHHSCTRPTYPKWEMLRLARPHTETGPSRVNAVGSRRSSAECTV